jgi:hypothetical protein
MKLEQAEILSNTLKQTLDRGDDKYWGDVYFIVNDESLPAEDRQYEVYIEYHGQFNLEEMPEILDLIGNQTYVVAQLTRQIIIWG